MSNKPAVVKQNVFAIQVCVPADYTEEQVTNFANAAIPCGTSKGWLLCENCSSTLQDDPQRVACAEREGFVHLVLEA